MVPYIVVQVVGAVVASTVLYLIASGKPDWVAGGFAANGYGDLSPAHYSLGACFLAELLLTFFFLMVIIGTTSKGAATGFAGIPIGLGLTLIHLISIPITNTSVNPARSIAPALFAWRWATSASSGFSSSPRSREPWRQAMSRGSCTKIPPSSIRSSLRSVPAADLSVTSSPETLILRFLAAQAHSSAAEIGRACNMTAAEVRARLVMLESMRFGIKSPVRRHDARPPREPTSSRERDG